MALSKVSIFIIKNLKDVTCLWRYKTSALVNSLSNSIEEYILILFHFIISKIIIYEDLMHYCMSLLGCFNF